MRYSDSDLSRVIEIIDSIRSDAQKSSTFAFDADWILFCKYMRILTSQSSGNRIQDYMFNKLGWTRVSSLLGKGDVVNTVGQYYEVKVTIITSSNASANIVQIRPWQQISGYHIFVIDAPDNYNLYHFALSKNEMRDELAICNAASAHGTKAANVGNPRVEYAIRVKWDITNKTYLRWVEKYLQCGTREVLMGSDYKGDGVQQQGDVESRGS